MDQDHAVATCSFCKTRLEAGTVIIHQTMLGFIVGGWSSPMYFRRGDEAEQKVLRPNKEYAAYRCPQCQTLVVRPSR